MDIRQSSKEADMQVARWGNSLAVRIPVELAEKLGLSEGDTLSLRPKSAHAAGASGGFAEGQAPFEAEGGTPIGHSATAGKWGNSLGVRLPQALVRELSTVEGDNVSLEEGNEGMNTTDKVLEVERKRSRAEALASFCQSRGVFTGSVQFPREDLLLRGGDVHD
jgi:antitoxin component of MazEF toxin-antitoxin module